MSACSGAAGVTGHHLHVGDRRSAGRCQLSPIRRLPQLPVAWRAVRWDHRRRLDLTGTGGISATERCVIFAGAYELVALWAATAPCTWSMSSARTWPMRSSRAAAGRAPGWENTRHAFAEHHERGDGHDAGHGRQALLGLGVDLGEHDVVVLLGGCLEHRGERHGTVRTRTPTSRPERCRCRPPSARRSLLSTRSWP